MTRKGARGSNLDDLVDAVRKRIAEKTQAGDLDGAAREADRGFAEWERMESERREAATRNGIALLEAGLQQDLLRRDAGAAARRVEKIVALEHPADAAARFAALRARQDEFYERRDQGINLDLEVAIEIARLALVSARNPDERGSALIRLGTALGVLGERESSTQRLIEAIDAFRAALQEYTRERAPLNWATTQNNLGNAFAAVGKRQRDTQWLIDAVGAFRAALQERTRERVPLQWATTQNNLGNALKVLDERESGTQRLTEAVEAFRAALQEYTREHVPLKWAITQNNLGLAMEVLAAREDRIERLEEAVDAYRAAVDVFEGAEAAISPRARAAISSAPRPC